MTNMIVPSRKVLDVIVSTKEYKRTWIRMSTFKDWLRNSGLSLSDVQSLHLYLEYLQKERFIFNCEDTYVSCYSGELLVLSKSKYSFDYRLDMLSIQSDNPQWHKIRVTLSMLLRLRNAIIVTDSDEDDCETLQKSISSECFA